MTPSLLQGIEPYRLASHEPDDLVTCDDLAYQYAASSLRIQLDMDSGFFVEVDGERVPAPIPPGLELVVERGRFVRFYSLFGVGAVIVEGEAGTQVYETCLQVHEDGLMTPPPPYANLPTPDVTAMTLCWNPTPRAGSDWCAGLYWRRHPEEIERAAAAGGFSMSERYSSHFGTTNPPRTGVGDHVNPVPTLIEILYRPTWWGGGAYDDVLELLNTSHPDLDYTGERPPNSCPFEVAPGEGSPADGHEPV